MSTSDDDALGSHVVPDPTQLKALTHPVRIRILGILRDGGPATASELGRRLGLNSGATSYHLRQLAKHGFVDEDTGRGNRRERWWRARHHYTNIRFAGSGDDESLDAYAAAMQAVVSTQFSAVQRAVNELPGLEPEWRDHATAHSDYLLHLSVDEATDLLSRVQGLIAEARQRTENATDHQSRRSFGVQLHGYVVSDPGLDDR